jgi:hypothetical protein
MEQTLNAVNDMVAPDPQAERLLDKSLNQCTDQRTDLITAAIVEAGLRLLDSHGFEHASEYLSAKMVPLRVTRRVLLNSSERRKPATAKLRQR